MKFSRDFTTITPFSKALTFLFLIFFPFIGFALGIQYQESISLPLTKATSPVIGIQKNNPVKMRARQFFARDTFFQSITYPTFLAIIPTADLIPMSCSPHYTTNWAEEKRAEILRYDAVQQQAVPVNDAEVITLSMQIMSSLPKESKLLSFLSCDTQDGRIIVEYEFINSNEQGSAQIGYLSEGKVSPIITLKERPPKTTCTKMLQLTKEQDLYLQCEEATGTEASIYKINLDRETILTTSQCQTTVKNSSTSAEIRCVMEVK